MNNTVKQNIPGREILMLFATASLLAMLISGQQLLFLLPELVANPIKVLQAASVFYPYIFILSSLPAFLVLMIGQIIGVGLNDEFSIALVVGSSFFSGALMAMLEKGFFVSRGAAFTSIFMVTLFLGAVVATIVMRWLWSRIKWLRVIWSKYIVAVGLSILVVFLILNLSGFAPSIVLKRDAKVSKPNVVLITSDALRKDKFNVDLMPKTYKWFADKGLIYSRVYAPGPWTAPSFASMFTGRYPMQLSADMSLDEMKKKYVLLKKEETLAEALNDYGYNTAAVVTNEWLTTARGFDQGFDRFVNLETREEYHWNNKQYNNIGLVQLLEVMCLKDFLIDHYMKVLGRRGVDEPFFIHGNIVTEEAISTIGKLEEPYFVWVHYVDPHNPYWPPDEFYPDKGGLTDSEAWNVVQFKESETWTQEQRDFVQPLYDGEVMYHDTEISRLLQWLDQKKLDKDDLVIFTSDHGEELFDHGRLGHGFSLNQELVNVPMAMAGPVENLIDSDVAWSLVNLSALIKSVVEGEESFASIRAEEIFVEGTSGKNTRKALVLGRYKLVWDIIEDQVKLVDLDSDLGSGNELSSGKMKELLVNWYNDNLGERKNYKESLREVQDVNEIVGY